MPLRPLRRLPRSSRPAAAAAAAGATPCVQEFGRLRDDASKKAAAIRAASARKAPPKEACQLFNVFSAAEEKMVKYAEDQFGLVRHSPADHRADQAAARQDRRKSAPAFARPPRAPPRPVGPTLSDALGAPITNSNNIKTGRGTFDTLTGTPLGNK